MDGLEETLLGLVLHDEQLIQDLLGVRADAPHAVALDARTVALVRLGVLIGLDAPAVAYQSAMSFAFAAGASSTDIVAVVRTVASVVGSVRVVAAAPGLAAAAGYDIDAALEDHRPPDDGD